MARVRGGAAARAEAAVAPARSDAADALPGCAGTRLPGRVLHEADRAGSVEGDGPPPAALGEGERGRCSPVMTVNAHNFLVLVHGGLLHFAVSKTGNGRTNP